VLRDVDSLRSVTKPRRDDDHAGTMPKMIGAHSDSATAKNSTLRSI
jgi:hypothetical protein